MFCKRKRFVFLLLISVLVLCWLLIWKPSEMIVTFGKNHYMLAVPFGSIAKGITLWEDTDGTGYYFLPSNASLEKSCFVFRDKDEAELIFINDREYRGGEFLNGLSYNTPYILKYRNEEKRVVFLKSAGLPAVYLETSSGSLNYIYRDKENFEEGHLVIVDEIGKLNYNSVLPEIKGHGNGTWDDSGEKKPLTLKLEADYPLLSMKSGKEWVLFANVFDSSYVRNAVSYELARTVGMLFPSDAKFVDLYINGEYRGNYQLVEKIEIGEDRVNIHDLARDNRMLNGEQYRNNESVDSIFAKGIPGLHNPEDISGGYLLEKNTEKKASCRASKITTTRGECYVLREPAYASLEEASYILGRVQAAENAIYDSDGIDDTSRLGYTSLIDVESFAQKYLLEEMLHNEADGATSSWFFKPQDAISERLFAGPVWDYDKSLGNHGSYADPRILTKLACYRRDHTEWFIRLLRKPEFYDLVCKLYKSSFRNAFRKIADERLDYYENLIEESVALDCIRWKKANEAKEAADQIKEFIMKRMDTLDDVFLKGKDVWVIRFVDDTMRIIQFGNAYDGECVTDMPYYSETSYGLHDEIAGWYDVDSGEKWSCEHLGPFHADVLLAPIYEGDLN